MSSEDTPPHYLYETFVLLGGQQDVLWFQISVDDPVSVEILYARTHTHVHLGTVEACCYHSDSIILTWTAVSI